MEGIGKSRSLSEYTQYIAFSQYDWIVNRLIRQLCMHFLNGQTLKLWLRKAPGVLRELDKVLGYWDRILMWA